MQEENDIYTAIASKCAEYIGENGKEALLRVPGTRGARIMAMYDHGATVDDVMTYETNNDREVAEIWKKIHDGKLGDPIRTARHYKIPGV